MSDPDPPHGGTVLLTGAAGFVGAKTAELLLARGTAVVGVDNLNDYYDARLKNHRIDAVRATAARPGAGAGAFTFYPADIEDRSGLEEIFSRHRFDAVLNLAARAGVRYSMENPAVYFSTNVLGNLHLLELMRVHGVGKLVLASTSSLYAGGPMPFREDLPVNTPVSPYAASKKAAEVTAYTYHHLYGTDVTVVRYFTVYGPAGRPDMSPLRFVHRIASGVPIELYGDGEQRRDFTYVDDIAAGTVLALKPLGYEIINLGGGNEPLSINAMIGLFEQHLEKPAAIDRRPFHPADMVDTWADISKARDLLGWVPQVNPEEGFRRTVEWYLENRPWLAEALREEEGEGE